MRSIHRIIDENPRLPWRDELLKISPQLLSVVVLLVFVTVVLLKAYAIGIIWRCYKYLTMRQHNVRSMLPYIIPEISNRQVGFIKFTAYFLLNGRKCNFYIKIRKQERDYSTLLPDYEEAIAQGMKQPPPPYYQVALKNQITTSLSIEQSHPQRTVTRDATPLETNGAITTAMVTATTIPSCENHVLSITHEMASTSTSANDNATLKCMHS